MFDRALAPLGITRSQWWVLAFISRKDGLPQTQLANELDVGKVVLRRRDQDAKLSSAVAHAPLQEE